MASIASNKFIQKTKVEMQVKCQVNISLQSISLDQQLGTLKPDAKHAV